jgi:hypothetical protein
MRKNIIICVLIILNLSIVTLAMPAEDANMRDAFENKYQEMKEFMRSPNFKFSSDRTGVTTRQFMEIVEFGPSALPYILEKMKDDSIMSVAVIRITKKHFHVIQTSKDPNDRRWSIEEYPDINNVKKIQWDKVVLRWWNEDAAKTPQQFDNLYQEWKKLKEEGKETEAKEKYQRMMDLGIFALPSMMTKIEQGNTEIISAVSELTDGKVDKNAQKTDCLDWWKKNKQKWLIPSARQ